MSGCGAGGESGIWEGRAEERGRTDKEGLRSSLMSVNLLMAISFSTVDHKGTFKTNDIQET